MTAITTVQAPEAEAQARAAFYDAVTWFAYAAMFLVIPMVVVLFRLHMAAVHYYLVGAAFLAFMALFVAADAAATGIRERPASP